MRRNNDLAALGLIGAALAILMTVFWPRASWAAPEDSVRWGLHEVELSRRTVTVHSEWSVGSAPDEAIPLAAPLPAQAELTGAEPVRDDTGAIVAVQVWGSGTTTLETTVPWAQVRRHEALPVPVPAGQSVHRVVLDPSLSFSPDPSLGLLAQVGHYAPASFHVVDRHRFDARTDGNLRHVGAYYVRGDDLSASGGLVGPVVPRRQRMARLMLIAGGLFGLLVLGMVIVNRRLSRRVRQERAEAFLEQEFRALDDEDFLPTAATTQTGAPVVSA